MAIDLELLRGRLREFDDGDWSYPSEYSIFEPAANAKAVVYSTKPKVAMTLMVGQSLDLWPAFLGHFGLPATSDLHWIRAFVRNRPIYFLGDFDPFDVLIYLALRDHLPMTYIQLSNEWLTEAGIVVGKTNTIALPVEERSALALLADFYPDYRSAIGLPCALLWEASRKLELEALVSGMTRPNGGLGSLLRRFGYV